MKIIIAPNGDRHTDGIPQGYGIDGGALFFRYYSPNDGDRRTFICHVRPENKEKALTVLDGILCGKEYEAAFANIADLRDHPLFAASILPPLVVTPAPEDAEYHNRGRDDFQQFEGPFTEADTQTPRVNGEEILGEWTE